MLALSDGGSQSTARESRARPGGDLACWGGSLTAALRRGDGRLQKLLFDDERRGLLAGQKSTTFRNWLQVQALPERIDGVIPLRACRSGIRCCLGGEK